MGLVEEARRDHYRRLRSRFHGTEAESVEQPDRFHLHTVVLAPESPGVGKTLAETGLTGTEATVQSVRRGTIRGEDPSPEMVLRAGDAVVLEGPPEALALAEQRLLRGA
jgi:CPA2 family monovalent cation:H+ antiporter-2